jgi:hypothetical protein
MALLEELAGVPGLVEGIMAGDGEVGVVNVIV